MGHYLEGPRAGFSCLRARGPARGQENPAGRRELPPRRREFPGGPVWRRAQKRSKMGHYLEGPRAGSERSPEAQQDGALHLGF